jgi:cytochrome P450
MNEPTTAPSAAQFILDAAVDLGRPRGGVAPTRDLGHLPGDGGTVAGIRNAFGMLRRGAAHSAAQVARYGRVHRTQLGPHPVVALADPELVLRMLRNEDRVWSSALAWRALFGEMDDRNATVDAPGQLDFEPHREARALLQPAFGAAATARYLELAAPRFEEAIESWMARGHVEFKGAIRRVLAGVSSRIFMGADDPAEAALFEREIAAIWAAPLALVRHRWLSPTWRRGVTANRHLCETFAARVAERRARGGPDLFSRMCTEERTASWIDDAALVRIYVGLVLASFDTTSSALASMGYLLAKHPAWQDRLREEARTVKGRPSYDDVKRFELGSRVWNETLRLYPVAPFVPRRALRDVDLGGHRIPAGALVHANIDAMMRDPSVWTRPETFDPERFGPDRAEDRRTKGSFLPFGSGVHACIGLSLAGAEALAFWHAMLTRCRFRLEPDRDAAHGYHPMGMVRGPVRFAIERV